MGLRKRYSNSPISKFLIAGVVFILVVQVALVIYSRQETLYAPLGEYPTQHVVNPGRTTDGIPIVESDDDVKVEATKCNATNGTVDVLGSVTWKTVDPRGTNIEVSTNAPGEREAGCTDLKFSNPIPAEVLLRTAELEADGSDRVTWRITGYEQPVDKNGKPGQGVSWSTDTFVIDLV